MVKSHYRFKFRAHYRILFRCLNFWGFFMLSKHTTYSLPFSHPAVLWSHLCYQTETNNPNYDWKLFLRKQCYTEKLFTGKHPMEMVLRVPRESSGFTGIMCNFGSGVSATLGFSLFTRYVFLIFSHLCSDMAEWHCKLKIYLLQEL